MTDLVDTTEMYLRTILDLEEERIVPLRARISERLGHSGPTVSQTISRMSRDGLVTVSDDRHLVLTDEGRARAVRVLRKHRLAERLLHDIIGLDWEYVHDEACRWEHVMSQNVENRIVELLDDPHLSPYGTPIPSPDDDEQALADTFLAGVRSLVDVTQGIAEPHVAVVRRLGEPVQVDPELLGRLRTAGIVPGAEGTFVRDGEQIVADMRDGSDEGITLALDIASHIYVDEQ